MSVYLKCCISYRKWGALAELGESVTMVGSPISLPYKDLGGFIEVGNFTTNVTTVTNKMNESYQVDSGYIPKGYSVPHIILTSILLSVIMFVIVFGNLLVVLAIFTDKTLKTTQNWFIASLAVADFLLGLVIMPFSLANEMMGYWYFGKVWCDLWKAIDVLLCTASILSICLISLDRYWSITRAITYSRNRTPKRAALMIAAVWFLSAIICVPPLIGWKNPLPVSEYPLCLLSDDIGYVLYSTMGSFYIPCVIMVFVYFKIFRAARKLARKNIKKNNKQIKIEIKDDMNTEFPSINNESTSQNSRINPEVERVSVLKRPALESVKEAEGTSGAECDINNENRTGENCELGSSKASDTSEHEEPYNAREANTTRRQGSVISEKSRTSIDSQLCESPTHKSEGHLFKSDSRRISMQKISEKFSKKRQRSNGNKSSKGWRTATLREHERQKRKIAKARERRATIVLGLVMAAFILCWCPFFTLYIITSFCYCVGEIVFTVVFWAGYCNSALNPIIYTVFNRDFRHAFHKILCKNALKCR